MKTKLILFLLLVPLLGFADLDMQKVNYALVSLKSGKSLTFYSDDTEFVDKLKAQKQSIAFTTKKNADVIIFPKGNEKNKMTIVGSYQQLKDDKESIGAIYMKKGRTQVVFVKERLKAHGIKIQKNKKVSVITECHFSPECFLTLKQEIIFLIYLMINNKV